MFTKTFIIVLVVLAVILILWVLKKATRLLGWTILGVALFFIIFFWIKKHFGII